MRTLFASALIASLSFAVRLQVLDDPVTQKSADPPIPDTLKPSGPSIPDPTKPADPADPSIPDPKPLTPEQQAGVDKFFEICDDSANSEITSNELRVCINRMRFGGHAEKSFVEGAMKLFAAADMADGQEDKQLSKQGVEAFAQGALASGDPMTVGLVEKFLSTFASLPTDATVVDYMQLGATFRILDSDGDGILTQSERDDFFAGAVELGKID